VDKSITGQSSPAGTVDWGGDSLYVGAVRSYRVKTSVKDGQLAVSLPADFPNGKVDVVVVSGDRWSERIDRAVDFGLRWAEATLIAMVAVWTVVGMVRYFWATGGTLAGLLTALNECWKGVVLLILLLFFRTLRPVAARLASTARIKSSLIETDSFSGVMGEIEQSANPQTPPQVVPADTSGDR
jgi:signal transduction histidine kinase